jgi:hypothetical protein
MARVGSAATWELPLPLSCSAARPLLGLPAGHPTTTGLGSRCVAGCREAVVSGFGLCRFVPMPIRGRSGVGFNPEMRRTPSFPGVPEPKQGPPSQISNSSPSPQPPGCDPPRLQEGPHIPVWPFYGSCRGSSTEKTQNVGVGSSFYHNDLSFNEITHTCKARVGNACATSWGNLLVSKRIAQLARRKGHADRAHSGRRARRSASGAGRISSENEPGFGPAAAAVAASGEG